MRDNLPLKINRKESGIINLDDKVGRGTHWTAYIKCNSEVKYFDSIGDLKPPLELVRYFYSDGNKKYIQYNQDRYQSLNSYNCGHLCLRFLYSNANTLFRQC